MAIAIFTSIFFVSLPIHAQENLNVTVSASELPQTGTKILATMNNGISFAFVSKDESGGCVQIRWSNIAIKCFDRSTLEKIVITTIPSGETQYLSFSIVVFRKGNLAKGIDSISSETKLTELVKGIKNLFKNVAELLEARDIHCIATAAAETKSVTLDIWTEI